LPIEVGDKGRLIERLATAGIAAIDFWSVPHPALPEGFAAGARRRRERTVLLPVHQGLRPDELERIASAAALPARRPRADLRLEPIASFSELGEEWAELAESSGNVFATREWSETWWRHFGRRRALHLIACRSRDGRLRGILPLYMYARVPLRILRFVGHGPADQLGPVCAAEDAPAMARALRRAVGELRPDLLIGDFMARDEGWSTLCGGWVLASQGAPVLRFDRPSWDEVLRARSTNLRQQVGRLERKLERERGLRYRLGGAASLVADLDLLFSLHAARWTGGHSHFTGPHVRFHRDFAGLAQERGWLRLWFLDADGRTVAAWHGFRFAGIESYYQAGRDPGWEGPSVGLVLLAHSIRSAFEDGMREYRFLRGEQPFKYRFANADPGVETIGVPCGPLGDAALAGGAVLPEAIAAPLRRRLGG
jgi:CelD/BcsL family acetyltransferase involved in cellulose biosynthesis